MNRQRGEVAAVLDGRTWTLCLTLGALAELEASLAAGDLMGLARRFEAGTLTASDAIRVIGAGLRGAGNDIDDAAVACMRAEGGAAGYVATVAELLAVTFGGETQNDSNDLAHGERSDRAGVSRVDPGEGI